MAELLTLIGYCVAAIGFLWILVTAFFEHILWGLGGLVMPIAAYIFCLVHYDKTWKPLAVHLGGVAMIFIGMAAGTR